MIYGSNFGYLPIPDDVRRKFPRAMQIAPGLVLHLQGVTDSEAKALALSEQAANDHRTVRILARREAYGVFCGENNPGAQKGSVRS